MTVDDLPQISDSAPNYTYVLGALVLLCSLLFVLAYARNWAPRVATSVGVALLVRAVAVWVAFDQTPRDVASYFRTAGELLLKGADPMTHMPEFRWNFLPFMPVVFGAELKTGINWEISGKIAPVIADLVLVVLLAKLGGQEHGRKVALLYALCPLAFLITAVHGQVEPIALAFGVGGYLAARRGRPGVAGTLLGLAIAAKTWPAVLVPGLLREIPWRRWWRALVGIAAVPLLFLLMIPFVLHDSLREAIHTLTGYRSFVGRWGWAGMAYVWDVIGLGYAGPGVDTVQRVGTLLTVVAVLAVLALLWKRGDGVVLTAGLMLVFFAVTAGFGPQYLLWPVPFVLLLGRVTGIVYVTLAGVYAAMFYMIYEALPDAREDMNIILPVGSLVVIVAGLVALPWRPRATPEAPPDRPDGPAQPRVPAQAGEPAAERTNGDAGPVRSNSPAVGS
ncbi:glycosyltransferase family 87 protein [Asanoa sp. WMMD1127]|uniref:glycosyltransferase family 87 protein n=1 Tax=Asanoa sp. WMMD1127 TaxID=3016107 RepID=UPI00241748D2|nr:glycosyltransferase family 87 protein [Asanoa sp. WMMD1127]MDG4824515.1 glycosyltransferase family 87 protein [Asanoa sp. WMMD1127]